MNITELARQAGWHILDDDDIHYEGHQQVKDALLDRLERFAALVIEARDKELLAGSGEPTAYLAWRDGKPCYEGDDAVCEDAVWPVDGDDDRASMPVFTADQLAAAVLAERERCAQIAEEPYEFTGAEASRIAAAIRKGDSHAE